MARSASGSRRPWSQPLRLAASLIAAAGLAAAAPPARAAEEGKGGPAAAPAPASAAAAPAPTTARSAPALLRAEARRLLDAGDYEGAKALYDTAAAAEREEEKWLRATLEEASASSRAHAAEAERLRRMVEAEKRPLWRKGWFWAGVGAGAAAVAVGVTVLALAFRPGPPENTQGTWDCTPPAVTCTR